MRLGALERGEGRRRGEGGEGKRRGEGEGEEKGGEEWGRVAMSWYICRYIRPVRDLSLSGRPEGERERESDRKRDSFRLSPHL